jgi:tryptophan synthase alpha chain
MADYLSAVESIRRVSNAPLLLFSYFNPILRYGIEALAQDAHSAGVDGVLVTDMIPEESEQYCSFMNANELDTIFLAAPTSDMDRIRKISACSRGFVYVVSRTGVTGTQQEISDSVLPTVQRVRQCTSLPVAVGFGISRPEQVQAIWKICDGAVVGSAIVSAMEKVNNRADLPSKIGEFCRWLTRQEKI